MNSSATLFAEGDLSVQAIINHLQRSPECERSSLRPWLEGAPCFFTTRTINLKFLYFLGLKQTRKTDSAQLVIGKGATSSETCSVMPSCTGYSHMLRYHFNHMPSHIMPYNHATTKPSVAAHAYTAATIPSSPSQHALIWCSSQGAQVCLILQ